MSIAERLIDEALRLKFGSDGTSSVIYYDRTLLDRQGAEIAKRILSKNPRSKRIVYKDYSRSSSKDTSSGHMLWVHYYGLGDNSIARSAIEAINSTFDSNKPVATVAKVLGNRGGLVWISFIEDRGSSF